MKIKMTLDEEILHYTELLNNLRKKKIEELDNLKIEMKWLLLYYKED